MGERKIDAVVAHVDGKEPTSRRGDGQRAESVLRGAGARSPMFWKVMLALTALVWGYSFSTMKSATETLPTFLLLACRFIPASIVMFLLFRKRIMEHFSKRYLVAGLGIGLMLWGGYAAQTLGLTGTTAGKSAFLTGTYCVLVPFVSYVIAREPLTRFNLGAAVLCLTGIALVALDDFSIEAHDLLTLLGAFFYALELAYTSKVGKVVDINVVTFWMFLATGILSAVSSFAFETWPPARAWTPEIIGSLVFLSLVCTCLALLLQNVGLAHVPAATGSLLLSLESPSGVLFSVLTMGEVITPRLLAGFALIFLAIVVSETHLSFLARR